MSLLGGTVSNVHTARPLLALLFQTVKEQSTSLTLKTTMLITVLFFFLLFEHLKTQHQTLSGFLSKIVMHPTTKTGSAGFDTLITVWFPSVWNPPHQFTSPPLPPPRGERCSHESACAEWRCSWSLCAAAPSPRACAWMPLSLPQACSPRSQNCHLATKCSIPVKFLSWYLLHGQNAPHILSFSLGTVSMNKMHPVCWISVLVPAPWTKCIPPVKLLSWHLVHGQNAPHMLSFCLGTVSTDTVAPHMLSFCLGTVSTDTVAPHMLSFCHWHLLHG